jgi:hypothetical protein
MAYTIRNGRVCQSVRCGVSDRPFSLRNRAWGGRFEMHSMSVGLRVVGQFGQFQYGRFSFPARRSSHGLSGQVAAWIRQPSVPHGLHRFWTHGPGLGNCPGTLRLPLAVGGPLGPGRLAVRVIRNRIVLNHEEDSFQPRRIQRRASPFFPGLSTHLAADASPAYHGPMPKD